MPCRFLLPAGLVAAQACVPLAHAQTAVVPTLEPVEVTAAPEPVEPNGRLPLDAVTAGASRLGLTPRETPATVTVVEREVIEARGAQDTQEALRAIPGVTAHDAPGNVGVTYRGFSGTSISQAFNGIDVKYGIAARPVDSWIVERVEAVGGPSSFLFGAGGVGGSINVISKLAEPGDREEAQLRLGTHGLVETSAGFNRRVAGDGTGSGDHYLRLDVNHRKGGRWTDGTDARATQLAASWRADLTPRLRHTLAYEYQHERVDRPYWGTPVNQPADGTLRVDRGLRFKNYNSADGVYGQRVQWLRSVTRWQASDALTLTNTAYGYRAVRDYRNVETYRLSADNAAVIRSAALLQRHWQRVVGNRLEGVYDGSLAGHRSTWAFGVDVSRNLQTRYPNSLSGTVSTVDPFDFAVEDFFNIPGMTPGFRADRTNAITTTAVYLENRTALVPNVHLVTALRHERIRLDATNHREISAASPSHLARTYRPTTGRVGLIWDVTPTANVYAQIATAADPPGGVLSTATFANIRDNTELSTGRQVEVGSKLDFWDGKGTATVAAYHITRRNIATQDPVNSALTVLVGEQSAKGVELSVGVKPAARWSVQGNVAYVDAQYETFQQGGVSVAGNRPTNTPAVVANLWAAYDITPQWQASAGVRHVGSVYADAANTLRWPSYTLLDVGLRWQVNRDVSLTARVRNVTDTVYAANASTGQVYLGAPRTADLALRVAF
ncbi:TonB-dependent siderophore receptor [Achromobacter sp. GG226]|uniref:TonB-dependent receptor n=1 Tax=Verticiella alkaliphila TaxID=2779529 RepID=UPI001C0DB957|nr:TonB-dependent siderophore receptor [Verticiella sp. GG226]MBU4612372.1 TonB-dependent siderophore receptor [Verticiella sp. GG226]